MAAGGKDQFYKEVASVVNNSAYCILYPVTKLWRRHGTEQTDVERKQTKVREEIDALVKAHLQQFRDSEIAELNAVVLQIEKDDEELGSLLRMLDIDAVDCPSGLKTVQQGQWLAAEVERLREEKKKRTRDYLEMINKKDVKRVQKSLADLENAKKIKTEEVMGMLDTIQNLYIRLEVPESEQLALASGAVCGIEELLCGDNYQDLLHELQRMETLKKEKIGFLISKSEERLAILQEDVLLSTSEIRLFWDKLEQPSNQSLEVTLDLLSEEIARLTEIRRENEAGLESVRELCSLSRLADNLRQRMNDPNRLFKARGNQMVQEEADRKKVNQIPKKCEKLLQTDFSLTIYGESLEDFIEKMLDCNGRKAQGKKPAAKGISHTITGASARSSQQTTGLCKATSLMSRSARAGGGGNRERMDAATPLTTASSSMGTRARRRLGEEGLDRRGGLIVPITTARPNCNSTEIYGARQRTDAAAALVDNNNVSTLIAGLLAPQTRRVGSPSLARHKNRKGHRRSQSVGDLTKFDKYRSGSRSQARIRTGNTSTASSKRINLR